MWKEMWNARFKGMKKKLKWSTFILGTASIGVMTGVTWNRNQLPRKDIVLLWDLRQPIREDSSNFWSTDLNMKETVESLERATNDSRVKGIVAKIGTPGSISQVQELREIIERFNRSKKFSVAYSEDFSSQDGYFLATAFDKIFMQPSGMVGLVGFYRAIPFLKGFLDLLEIKPVIVKTHNLKTAPNLLTEANLTNEHREMEESIVNALFSQLTYGLSRSRPTISMEGFARLIDEGPFSDKEAKAHGLIDDLLYVDEIEDYLKSTSNSRLSGVSLRKYATKTKNNNGRQWWWWWWWFYPKDKIAIIYLTGTIFRNPFGRGENSKTIAAFDSAISDRSVKAIVFRIDCPGGDAILSEAIWRKVVLARKCGKCVIASFSTTAASGGYMVASACDKIVANPASFTGSIGVFSGKPIFTEFLKNKLGIKVEEVMQGKHASLMGFSQPSDSEIERLNALVNAVYENFIEKVSQGRHLSKEKLAQYATGRVFVGSEAVKIGLVDEIGGFLKAVELAKSMANVSECRVVELPGSSFMDSIRDLFVTEQKPLDYVISLIGRKWN